MTRKNPRSTGTPGIHGCERLSFCKDIEEEIKKPELQRLRFSSRRSDTARCGVADQQSCDERVRGPLFVISNAA
jgi:hypothetical protein